MQPSGVKQPEAQLAPELAHEQSVPGRFVPEQFVTVARIQTTHSRHGEVAADLLTDFPERLGPGAEVLVGSDGRHRRLRIENAWLHKAKHRERLILKFQGVDTLTEAETLAGSLVQLPLAERHPLPPGRLYVSDLIGCDVLEGGRLLGKVEAWDETGGVPLLRVAVQRLGPENGDGPGGELLIPYAAEICYAVDTAKKEIQVRLPEGLQELNSSARRKKGGA